MSTIIEWTDRTWNPIQGGSLLGLDQPLRWRKPARVVVCPQSDLFHESTSNEEIAAVFAVMAAAHRHSFQVLTKRPKRMRAWFAWVSDDPGTKLCDALLRLHYDEGFACAVSNWVGGWSRWQSATEDGNPLNGTVQRWPLTNVWLGVSVEDQATADERIPLLLETPAAMRFVSAEPLLDRVNLTRWLPCSDRCGRDAAHSPGRPVDLGPFLDWVIVGGESGHGARECEVSWIRRIVSDCECARVPVFVKQLGSCARDQDHFGVATERLTHRKGGDMTEWPKDLRVRQFPEVRP